MPDNASARRPPSAGPSHPKSHQKSVAISAKSRKTKVYITDQQRVKVRIIDGKRCGVRSLLISAYINFFLLLLYGNAFLNTYHRTIRQSLWCTICFVGYIFSLLFTFFGTGGAVNTLTYAWNPIKFIMGIVLNIIGSVGCVLMYFIGSVTDDNYTEGIHNNLLYLCDQFKAGKIARENITMFEEKWGFVPFKEICENILNLRTWINFMPFILPPVNVVCSIIAVLAAIKAIYITPGSDEDIDAPWLEPYEVYDFYVGKNVPRTPGYDEAYEGTLIDTSAFSLSGGSDDEEETEGEGEGGKKKKKKKKKKKHEQNVSEKTAEHEDQHTIKEKDKDKDKDKEKDRKDHHPHHGMHAHIQGTEKDK